ncbi:MAG: DUF4376 domain-containing protein [Acidiphilium sp.]
MHALVFNGKVIQIEAETFPVHSALEWAPIPSGEAVAVGWSYANGAFSAPPAPPPPTLAQQATAALSAGLAITSTNTPALDGTYSCDDAAQARINRVAVYVQMNGKFPGGTSTIAWLDATGAQHVFSVAQFQAFATAVGDYVAALDDVILGLSTTLPSAAAPPIA